MENETRRIEIKKAKLTGNLTLEATYFDMEGNEVTLKGANKCHADLREAFRGLVPFFADLTEQKEADCILWAEPVSEVNADLLRKLDVHGLSITDTGSARMVTMNGSRILATSQTMNFNAPAVDVYSETLDWPHLNDFDLAVQCVLYEAGEYIISRKYETTQLELGLGADDPFAKPEPTDELPPLEEIA